MSITATETVTKFVPEPTENKWAMPGARWEHVVRPYSKEDVTKLRGTVKIEYSLARLGAERLWKLLQEEDYVPALGAMTGNQAVQQVKAGLKAIYLSGWQVAADANLAGEMYPDQSLYPANSAPCAWCTQRGAGWPAFA
jgi:isocitrate lyase